MRTGGQQLIASNYSVRRHNVTYKKFHLHLKTHTEDYLPAPESYPHAAGSLGNDNINTMNNVSGPCKTIAFIAITVLLLSSALWFTMPAMKPANIVAASTTAGSLGAALNITFFNGHSGSTIAPHPLPPPGPSSGADAIVEQFSRLGRSTRWALAQRIALEGPAFEPEGLARLGPDRLVVSAGEYTERPARYPDGRPDAGGNDRTAGAGFAHLIVFDGAGGRVADATLTGAGETEYHNGGIDYDGRHIWATLSEYRPNSTATVVKVDPATLVPAALWRVRDHQGGVVHDPRTGNVTTLNWGSREASLWCLGDEHEPLPEFTTPKARVKNPSHWIDYQDCKFLGQSKRYGGRNLMICSGIADIGGEQGQQEKVRVGGVAIVDMLTMVPLMEVPIPMVTENGTAMAKNPFDVAVVDGKMRFYFLPEEDKSTLYVYEALEDV
jgi:hypothetical protein